MNLKCIRWMVGSAMIGSLALVSGTALSGGVELGSVEGGFGPPAIRGGEACAGGEIYDDGSAENGYSGDPAFIDSFHATQLFTPSSFPAGYDTVCVALISLGGDDLDFEIEVHDSDGPGGSPGTLLGSMPFSVDGIPGGLPCAFYELDISGMNLNIAGGSVYIGVRYNPMEFPSRFVCSDESPATPLHPGFVKFALGGGWAATESFFPGYRAKLIRAIQGEAGGGPIDLPDSVNVPTLGTLGLVALIVLLLGLTLIRLRSH